MHPEWFNLGEVQETTAERDANLRLTLYIAGQQLAKPTGRTMGSIRIGWQRPAASPPGLVYVRRHRMAATTLKLSRDRDRVTLTSHDSLNDFLKPSLSRLVQRKGSS